MTDIHWVPERPADAAFATKVEKIVHATLGRDAVGRVSLFHNTDGILTVPPARVVPAPTVWDTLGESIRVDDGIVEALKMAGVRAR